ncbi:MAG: hypothetical protein AAGE83_01185, partial [Pseudomonadota bacterium]
WTEWYEARLRGDPGNPALEYDRVTSPEIDWKAGPATVNAKIKEIIEKYGRRGTPVAKRLEVDRERGEITTKAPQARELLPEEDSTAAAISKIEKRLRREADRLTSEEPQFAFAMLQPRLRMLFISFDEDTDDPVSVYYAVEGALIELRGLRDKREIPDETELRTFENALERAQVSFENRFPAVAAEAEAQAAHQMRRVTAAELSALEAAFQVFEEIMTQELSDFLGADLEAVREVGAPQVKDDAPLPASPLKVRLYRLKGYLLQAKNVAETSLDDFNRIVKKADTAARQSEKFRKAMVQLEPHWQKLWSWLMDGAPPDL